MSYDSTCHSHKVNVIISYACCMLSWSGLSQAEIRQETLDEKKKRKKKQE